MFQYKNKSPELYWSLVLEPGLVQAGIWFIKGDEAEVLCIGSSSPWETDEDLTGAVDTALSSVIQKLGEDEVEPTKTVFGVSSSWVTGGEIKEEFLQKIKGICTELSLTPVGFVVLPEAIANIYKSEEESPINAIIFGLGKDFIEISVFKLGNLVGTTQVVRSVSLVDDAVEGLSRFDGANPLPSRFIIYDGKMGEIDEARDNLVAANWDGFEKIKFLHTPKVETFSVDKKVLAVSLAGASEIGKVKFVKTRQNDEIENISEPINTTSSASEMGFVVGKDVSDKVEKPAPIPVKAPLRKLNFTFPKNKILLTLGVLLTTFILLFVLWLVVPKATVSIFVSPKKFSEETEMIISDGRVITSTVSGEKTIKTSGIKLIGDKAKGSVIIQNGTPDDVRLSTGTAIVSSGNLSFNLDSSASVSAALSPSSPGTATVSVTATSIGAESNLAKDETFKVGNFSKADIDAVAEANFSGGSSREISAVSKDDRENLEKSLSDELSQNALNEISSQVKDDEIFVGVLISQTAKDVTFSAKVGDDSDTLKLNLEIEGKSIAISRSILLESAKKVLKDKIPEGYVLRDDQIDFGFVFESEDVDGIKFKVSFSANFLPQVKVDEIKKKISGKSPTAVEDYLSQIPGFSHAEIIFKPSLPGGLKVLPRIKKNLTIEVVAEK